MPETRFDPDDLPFDLPLDPEEPEVRRATSATVYSDASLDHDSMTGGLACWVRYEGGREVRSRHVRAAESIVVLEAAAVQMGVEIAIEQLPNLRTIYVRTDSEEVIVAAKADEPSLRKSRACLEPFREFMAGVRVAYEVRLKHVKAHQDDGKTSSWINNWCDAAAKTARKHIGYEDGDATRLLLDQVAAGALSQRDADVIRGAAECERTGGKLTYKNWERVVEIMVASRRHAMGFDAAAEMARLLEDPAAMARSTQWAGVFAKSIADQVGLGKILSSKQKIAAYSVARRAKLIDPIDLAQREPEEGRLT
jgi:ribonuclease HI